MPKVFKCPECGLWFEVEEYAQDANTSKGINLICDCGHCFNVKMTVKEYDIVITPNKQKE